MNGFLMKAGLGAVVAATTLAAAAPADAQRWRGHRGYDRGGDVAAGALIGGVIGLGLGAAIASDRGRGYDRGYYDRGYYGPPPRAYYRQRYYRPRGYYPRRNYYRGYGYGYGGGYGGPPPGYYGGW